MILSNFLSIDIDITNECNMNCSYCYHTEKTGSMDIDVINKVINNISRFQTVYFMGGEPLLHFNKIVYFIVSKNPVRWSLTSNLTLLNYDKYKFIKANRGTIQASIDGSNIAHDMHRRFKNGAPSHKKVVENYIAYKDIIKSVRMTITPENLPYLYNSIVYLYRIGIYKIAHSFAQGNYDWELFKETIKKLAEFVLKHKNLKLKIFTDFAHIKKQYALLPCGAGTSLLSVGSFGLLYLCHRFTSTDDTYGSIYSEVNQEKLDKFKNLFKERHSACLACDCLYMCRGGCPHISYVTTGTYTELNQVKCISNKIIYPIAKWLFSKGLYNGNPV